VRDVKQVGVRLNADEVKAVETMARDRDVTVSELVRLLIHQEAERQHKQEAVSAGHAARLHRLLAHLRTTLQWWPTHPAYYNLPLDKDQ
jgi:hypothetical protein